MLILTIIVIGMAAGWLAQLVLGRGTNWREALIAGRGGSFVGGLLASDYAVIGRQIHDYLRRAESLTSVKL